MGGPQKRQRCIIYNSPAADLLFFTCEDRTKGCWASCCCLTGTINAVWPALPRRHVPCQSGLWLGQQNKPLSSRRFILDCFFCQQTAECLGQLCTDASSALSLDVTVAFPVSSPSPEQQAGYVPRSEPLPRICYSLLLLSHCAALHLVTASQHRL